MSKLVKHLENDTDFDVCIFMLKSGKYAVTVYDTVNKTHEKKDVFDSYTQALLLARTLNKEYMFENKTVKLSESKLKDIISECITSVLKEDVLGPYDDDNYMGVQGANRTWDSDEDFVSVSVPGGELGSMRKVMDEKMNEMGYVYNTVGYSGNKAIITYRKK